VKERDGGREDQWFRENEERLLEQARVLREKRAGEVRQRDAAEERKRLRELHHMKCPKCGHDMREEELGTIHVDRCGLCGGTYFDAGELDHVVLKKEQDGRGFFRRLIGI
jgi:uncharacterized protein